MHYKKIVYRIGGGEGVGIFPTHFLVQETSWRVSEGNTTDFSLAVFIICCDLFLSWFVAAPNQTKPW